jgi:hypothetical protein
MFFFVEKKNRFILVSFYVMIVSSVESILFVLIMLKFGRTLFPESQATAAWFYDGQQSLDKMSFCETVSSVLAIHSNGTAATAT